MFELCFELIVDVLCGSVDVCRPVNRKKKDIYIESSFPLDSLRVGQKPHARLFSHLIEVVPSIDMFLE